MYECEHCSKTFTSSDPVTCIRKFRLAVFCSDACHIQRDKDLFKE